MRFSEALALTPKDFDFSHQSLIVDKTWDYKGDGGFLPTKNKSSVRKIQLDWQTIIKFSELIKGLPDDKPIFVKGRVFNSTINGVLERYCKKLGIPVISIHGLRHTHASLLLFCRCVNCKCCKTIRSCEYDDDTENIYTYNSGNGK